MSGSHPRGPRWLDASDEEPNGLRGTHNGAPILVTWVTDVQAVERFEPTAVRRRLRPRLPLGLVTWWARAHLDRELAAGANPAAEPRRAYRAQQLTEMRTRRRVASGIERVVNQAQRSWRGASSGVPLQRRAVIGARPALLTLARALVTAGTVRARGVALGLLLLTDGSSPLYFAADAQALTDAGLAAVTALADCRSSSER
jgi:hypothetical protein